MTAERVPVGDTVDVFELVVVDVLKPVDVPVFVMVIDLVGVSVTSCVLLTKGDLDTVGEELDDFDEVIDLDTEVLAVLVRDTLPEAVVVTVDVELLEELILEVPVLDDVVVLLLVDEPVDVLVLVAEMVNSGEADCVLLT